MVGEGVDELVGGGVGEVVGAGVGELDGAEIGELVCAGVGELDGAGAAAAVLFMQVAAKQMSVVPCAPCRSRPSSGHRCRCERRHSWMPESQSC